MRLGEQSQASEGTNCMKNNFSILTYNNVYIYKNLKNLIFFVWRTNEARIRINIRGLPAHFTFRDTREISVRSNMIIKISNIAYVKIQIYANARETRKFHISRRDSTLQSFHARTEQHTFIRREGERRGWEHITALAEWRERTFLSSEHFFSSDSRSRYMALESFQGDGFVIFRAKIEAKSVCKVPPDFPRFLLRFRASCYHLGNIDLNTVFLLLRDAFFKKTVSF